VSFGTSFAGVEASSTAIELSFGVVAQTSFVVGT
jgi:hypothetical protein